MLQLIALLLSVTLVCGEHRIFGGTNASIEDYPYQISLEANGHHSCGGSIVSPVKILTAAHCTDNLRSDAYRVRAGSSLREEGGQLSNVVTIHEHPEYNTINHNNDIAVVILEQPLVYDNYVQPIEMSQILDAPVGTYATVTGWGVIESGERAKRLQTVQVPRVNDVVCKNRFPNIYNTTTTVCYGGEKGKSACHSDSGGPLVIDGKQVGIVSYGPGFCGTGAPDVYVKVRFFNDFINNSN